MSKSWFGPSASRLADPLRLRPDQFWFWALLLTLSAAAPALFTIAHGYGDWRAFALSGIRVGSSALLHPSELWQAFLYPPAAAYAIAPFARLPAGVGYAVTAGCMVICAAGSAFVAARTYGFHTATAIVFVFAWWPTLYGTLVVAQNATFGLLCTVLAITGMATGSVVLTALSVGVLLYKPMYALPFIWVLVVRGRIRELALVAALGCGWYLASVPAAGGDWAWPRTLAQLIATYAESDFQMNSMLSIGLPGTLHRFGIGPVAIAFIAAFAAGIATYRLSKVDALEAGTAASLLGLALSPHAWGYDAALVMPALFFVAARVREPTRTRLFIAAYGLAPTLLLTPMLCFDPLLIVVVGGSLAWIASDKFQFIPN